MSTPVSLKKERLEKIEKQNNLKNQDTLCWTCQYCTGRAAKCFEALPTSPDAPVYKYTTCPWATHGQPVPGWTAIRQKLKVAPHNVTESYFVAKCPCYSMSPEVRVAQLTTDQLSAMLGISGRYVRESLGFARQVGYIYVKRMTRLMSKLGPEERITDEKRYEMRKSIMEEYRQYALDALELSEREPLEKEKEAKAEIKQAKSDLKGAKRFLKNLENNWKARQEMAAQKAHKAENSPNNSNQSPNNSNDSTNN